MVVPNWSGHLLLMGLVPFFSGPVAERIAVACYVIGLPLAFRYALRGVTADTQSLEFLAFPLIYNMHLVWGFYSFCLSLVVFLLLLGFVLRFDRSWTRIHTAVLTVLALVLYLSHGLMFLFGFMTVMLLSVLRNRTWPSALRATLRTVLAFLPGLMLFGYYYLFRANRAGSVTEWPTLRYAASLMATLSPLAPFGGVERWLGGAYALLLYGLAGVRLWQLRGKWPVPELLLLGLLGVVSVFAFPVTASGGTMATPRLVYFPIFVLIAWLAASPMPKQLGLFIAAASILTAGGQQLTRLSTYRTYNREMTQLALSLNDKVRANGLYMEFPGDTLGPLTGAPDLSSMALCYLGIESEAIILTNYEAAQDHFPLIFRKGRNPYPTRGALNGHSMEAADGVLALCNSAGKGVCEANPFGRGYEPLPLAYGPLQARWFVRKAP